MSCDSISLPSQEGKTILIQVDLIFLNDALHIIGVRTLEAGTGTNYLSFNLHKTPENIITGLGE